MGLLLLIGLACTDKTPGDTAPPAAGDSTVTGPGETGETGETSETGAATETGETGETNPPPEAALRCPESVLIPGIILLDGTDSTDPRGEGLSYHWAIDEAPPGSAGALHLADGAGTTLFADAAGAWRVSLRVEDAIGVLSQTLTCDIEAVIQGIHVEVEWADEVDLDLHMARDDAAFYADPGDVSWCNPNPDWSDDGAGSPDHLWDASDLLKTEHIIYREPAESTYRVRVHGYGGYGTAVVRIWVDGEKLGEYAQLILDEEVWDAAAIDMATGEVTAGPAATYPAENTQCWTSSTGPSAMLRGEAALDSGHL